MITYNAEELFQMAEAVEHEGRRFYRQAAAAVGNPELAELLNQLAEWEGKHEERFAAMRAELPESARHETGPGDPVEEHAADYLHAFVDGKVFPGVLRPGDSPPPLATPSDVLGYALAREKDTIIFFLTLQAQVPKYWGRERIQGIIEEELKHVHLLEHQRRKLAAGGILA